MGTKLCSKCREEKPQDEFYNCKTGEDGKASWCKACRKVQAKSRYQRGLAWVQKYPQKRKAYIETYREKNREKLKAEGQEYYLANREKIRACNHEYYMTHTEETLARNRQYHQEHLAEMKAWRREYCREHSKEAVLRSQKWAEEHPDRARTYARQGQRKRRARKQTVNESFSIDDEKSLRAFWGNCCAICGKTREKEGRELSIDHWYPLSKGHALTMGNAVLMCISCNGRKWAYYPLDVFDVATVERVEAQMRKYTIVKDTMDALLEVL